ncbi:hypothetical protein DVH24_040700, partial [Malus domestica]
STLILIKRLITHYLSVPCVSPDFDFFYFVQQVVKILSMTFNLIFRVFNHFAQVVKILSMTFSLLFLRSQNPTWPGAYCDATNFTCCYPKSGKPTADFGIHGPWPNYKDGGYPSKT